MIQAEPIKFRRYIAIMAIQYQQLMRANYTNLYMLIKDLRQLGQANFIYYLAIITNTNQLVMWYNIILILGITARINTSKLKLVNCYLVKILS